MRDMVAFIVLELKDGRELFVRYDQIESFVFYQTEERSRVRTLSGETHVVSMSCKRIQTLLHEAARRVKEYEQQQWVKNHAEM